jgi:hypothetical protein
MIAHSIGTITNTKKISGGLSFSKLWPSLWPFENPKPINSTTPQNRGAGEGGEVRGGETLFVEKDRSIGNSHLIPINQIN